MSYYYYYYYDYYYYYYYHYYFYHHHHNYHHNYHHYPYYQYLFAAPPSTIPIGSLPSKRLQISIVLWGAWGSLGSVWDIGFYLYLFSPIHILILIYSRDGSWEEALRHCTGWCILIAPMSPPGQLVVRVWWLWMQGVVNQNAVINTFVIKSLQPVCWYNFFNRIIIIK